MKSGYQKSKYYKALETHVGKDVHMYNYYSNTLLHFTLVSKEIFGDCCIVVRLNMVKDSCDNLYCNYLDL